MKRSSTKRKGAGLWPVLVTALVIFAAGAAQAAWQVTDQQAENYLKSINQRVGDGNMNSRLNNIYDAYKLGSSGTAGKTEPEPAGTEQLSKAAPSTATAGADERCPPATGDLAILQRQICTELMDTERAKYMYSLRMYQLTDERVKRLEKLEDERSKLSDHDYGRLQDNSNKLLALMSLMQIDAQRHKTYMDAYDARMAYLVSTRDALTRQALHGAHGLSLGSVGGAVLGGGTLAAALEAVKSHSDYKFN